MTQYRRESVYKNCVYCGTGTRLRIAGVPVCPFCSKELLTGRKPPYREHAAPSATNKQAA